MLTLTVGQQVIAKQNRILEFDNHDPIILWKKGQVLTIGGIIQHSPGQLEFLIDLAGGDWENVPMPIMEELFESLPTSSP